MRPADQAVVRAGEFHPGVVQYGPPHRACLGVDDRADEAGGVGRPRTVRRAQGEAGPLHVIQYDVAGLGVVRVDRVPQPEGLVGRPPDRAAVAGDQGHPGAALGPPVDHGPAVHRRGDVEEHRGQHDHQEPLGQPHVMDHHRFVEPVDRGGTACHGAGRADGRPGEVGRLQAVAEDHHLAGDRIGLRVRGDAGRQRPAERLLADRLQIRRHQERAVGFGEGQQASRVAHHVDVRQVPERSGQLRFHIRDLRHDQRFDTAPQGPARAFLGDDGRCPYEAVAVPRPAAGQPHPVQHAVPVDRIEERTDGAEAGVGAVAQEQAVELVRQFAEHLQSGLVHLVGHRGEPARQMDDAGRVEAP